MGKPKTVLITGGAGFVGCNLTERLLKDPSTHVRILDNMTRPGVIHNATWLSSLSESDRLEIVEGDVRDKQAVRRAAEEAEEIYHLAAQVAVTTSLEDPTCDFDVNARGTLNVLEAARLSGKRPFFLFTSTNKVYGSLSGLRTEINGTHYRACDPIFQGVDENEPLDFHSPYGCSKGAADQYVRDYARIYDLPTVVFRMSCIAGPRQFGNEDQGWVAHFLYSALLSKPVTVYGNGYQVRDILHVQDLVDAMISARDHVDVTRGKVYNLGGGIKRSVSVLEMLGQIEQLMLTPLKIKYRQVRPGDQPLYISSTSRLEQDTGWRAQRSLKETLLSIHEFWKRNRISISSGLSEHLQSVALEEEVA